MPTKRHFPLLIIVGALLALGWVAIAVIIDLSHGDQKCQVVGADSVYGDATWRWGLLGTTCDYSAVSGDKGAVSDPLPWRLPVALAAVMAIALALWGASQQDRRRLGVAAAVAGLCLGVAMALASRMFNWEA